MKITVTKMDALTPLQRGTWLRWQDADPLLASPYFHPAFVELSAAVRQGVEVALLEEDGALAGFFPFERRRRCVGVPVAAPLNDFQGVIARPGLVWDARELVRGCGLAAWRFDHLLAAQSAFQPHHGKVAPSPWMDLSRGFEAYLKDRLDAGCTELSQARRKARKAQSQLGPLRFVAHTDADEVFSALARWKGDQYVRSNVPNLFGYRWIVALLENIRRRQGEQFSGVLSALYLGDRLAAVHLGMRCRQVLHFWFPAYDPALARFSPGMILFMEIARAAPGLGIERIDLGKGPEAFKRGLMSGSISVAEGAVECGPVARALGHVERGALELARLPMLRAPARLAAHLSRPLRQWRMVH